MTDSNHYDTIIIGAGPAGATAATVLTEHGRRVVVLEKDKFPRYRLGESLLPYCYFTLERLGMIDKLNANGYVKKYSVPFVNLEGRISAPFYFVQHMNHSASQTWQVERSRFDQMMIDNAVSRGAEVRFGTAARHLLTDGDAVRCGDFVINFFGEGLGAVAVARPAPAKKPRRKKPVGGTGPAKPPATSAQIRARTDDEERPAKKRKEDG